MAPQLSKKEEKKEKKGQKKSENYRTLQRTLALQCITCVCVALEGEVPRRMSLHSMLTRFANSMCYAMQARHMLCS
jgi:hypothetical protein